MEWKHLIFLINMAYMKYRDERSNMAESGGYRMENVVEYRIFDLRSVGEKNEATLNIEDTLCEVISYGQLLICDYIWQNECFNLHSQKLKSAKEMAHYESIEFLEGFTNFGDNIEDEWFIVYILFSITKQFPHLVVAVNDNDGEFLLIEAAEYLPKWLEPETSENRIFIHQGKLCIIPLPQKPSEITVFPTGKLTVNQALKILKSNSEQTLAFPWIQDPIMKKVMEYPSKAKDCFHNVLCYVPAQVKYLLERNNALISPAVMAFVNRDPVDMKRCEKLTHFRMESLVPYRVCFTKCLYSQLVKQNFIPDKSKIKFFPGVFTPSYKGYLIGLELAYGFEIMYNQQGSSTNGMATPSTPSGQHWEKYLSSLIKYGYFQNEVVGSRLYNQLLEKAKRYFTNICMQAEQSQNRSNGIRRLLEGMPVVEKVMDGSILEEFPPDDNDDWLEVSAEELESILSQYDQSGLSSSEDVDLREVVSGMNSFVESISSYEGAEFPSELDKDTEIQFDSEGFMNFFTRPSVFVGENDASDDDDDDSYNSSDEQINEYSSAMDQELSATNVGKSFVKVEDKTENRCSKDESAAQTEEDGSIMKPVDIDLNLVQNFLESYSLQEGLPGPVSNILGSMGINLKQPHL